MEPTDTSNTRLFLSRPPAPPGSLLRLQIHASTLGNADERPLSPSLRGRPNVPEISQHRLGNEMVQQGSE